MSAFVVPKVSDQSTIPQTRANWGLSEPVFNLSKLTKLQYLEIQFYNVAGQENGGDADRRLNGWTLAVVQTLTSKTLKSFSSDDVYVQFRVPDDVQENEQES